MAIRTEKQENYFYTAAGRKVEFQPISIMEMNMATAAVEKRYRDAGEPIDPPTYEVEIVGGAKEIHKHDETTLVTEEDKQAWARYRQAVSRMEEEQTNIRTEIMLDGIIADPDADTEWEQRQRRYGIEIPEDKNDRRIHYINTVILRTPEDIGMAIEAIMTLSVRGAVTEEEIESASATFRGNIRAATDEAGNTD